MIIYLQMFNWFSRNSIVIVFGFMFFKKAVGYLYWIENLIVEM